MPSMSIKSFGVVLALMLGVFFASGNARADAAFAFTLSGQIDQQSDPPAFYPWTGKLTVVLDTGADGVYGNADMVSFDLVSNWVTFHEPSFTPIPFIANFTVADGKLKSIGAAYYDASDPDVVTSFGALTVSYFQPLVDFTPQTVGTATLTPVPEPGSGAMLLFGLALAVAGARINRGRCGAA